MASQGGSLTRRVLHHPHFDLHVCWPKTHWARVPEPGGTTTVLVDGVPTVVTVGAEQCNCQGTGWHEHRYLAFSDRSDLVKGAHVMVSTATGDVMSLSGVVNRVADAQLLVHAIPAPEALRLAEFVAARQGLDGSYFGLFAPTPADLDGGYRVPTGESVRSDGGARHIAGEEALWALLMLERLGIADPAVRAACERASEAMGERLARPAGDPMAGTFCCMTCTVALWRALTAGAYDRQEERLAAGIAALRARRDGEGSWKGFPAYYTLLALVGIGLPAAKAELAYAAPGLERRIALLSRRTDAVSVRRAAVLAHALSRA